MQKDFHYYLTFALAIKAGIEFDTAKAIAWSNQFTDDCKDFDRYGIRTMVDITWKTSDCFVPEVQRFVFVPFHFLPGSKDSLVVKADSELAKMIVDNAIGFDDPIALGIALHSLQDTFSHQNFTGVQDNNNAKHKWDLQSIIAPRIGHAEFGHDPDIININWNRNRDRIRNNDRAHAAYLETNIIFNEYCKNDRTIEENKKYLIGELIDFWFINNYEKRKKWLLDWADIGDVHRYSLFEPPKEYIERFVKAAKKQQGIVFNYLN